MTILLDPYPIPEKGQVQLKVEHSFEIKVTAAEARRRVNRWLCDQVSVLLGADPPTLVVGEQVVWRVPVWISFPHTGRAGQVGTIEVEVTSGAMNNTPECQAEIVRQAEAVADRQPPYRPKEKVPEPYLPKHVPPAPKLRILEDGALAPVTPSEKEQA